MQTETELLMTPRSPAAVPVAKSEAVTRNAPLSRPRVFDFMDYRVFLKEMYDFKKTINPSYSENAFIFSAGFGKNSRGYLGLILKGKRNLASKSIIGFSEAMGLNAKEAIFFENMVLFNQSESEKEKIHFFERMKVGAVGEESKLVQILSSQYRFLNEWHLIVLREIINLKDFKENIDWIEKKLKSQISKEKIKEGIEDLLTLGLLARDAMNKLVQSEPIVLFTDNKQNFKNSNNLHKQFCQKAAHAMEFLPYEQRAAQLITLSIPAKEFESLRKELQETTQNILKKYANHSSEKNDLITQIGIQMVNITE